MCWSLLRLFDGSRVDVQESIGEGYFVRRPIYVADRALMLVLVLWMFSSRVYADCIQLLNNISKSILSDLDFKTVQVARHVAAGCFGRRLQNELRSPQVRKRWTVTYRIAARPKRGGSVAGVFLASHVAAEDLVVTTQREALLDELKHQKGRNHKIHTLYCASPFLSSSTAFTTYLRFKTSPTATASLLPTRRQCPSAKSRSNAGVSGKTSCLVLSLVGLRKPKARIL